MPAPRKTLYDVLGVSPDASQIDIGLAAEKRFAELEASAAHDPSETSLLREAREVLSHPARRAAYDAALLTEREKAAAREQAQAPDLLLEESDGETARPRIPPVGIGVGIVALLVIAFAIWHSRTPPAAPAPVPLAAAQAPAPPVAPRPKAAKDILAAAQRSVGRLQGFQMSGRAVPLGLALAIEGNAMLTTCHGIPAGSQLVVTMGAEHRSASLLVADETLDLCRLSVAPPLEPLALADREARAGDKVYSLGANAAGDLALTEGSVKAAMPDARGQMLELSMPIAPGGSGGPVFDEYGKLVGIATTAQGHGAAVSLAIPASWIARMRSREGG